MDRRGMKVVLVGINKVLSEEVEDPPHPNTHTELAGELLELRERRQAVRLPGLCQLW